MISKDININDTTYRLSLTDQVIYHVNNLKSLYEKAYDDPEIFEQISSEISSTINEIALAIEPKASDSDLDGIIQEIIKITDSKAAELQNEISNQESKRKRSRSKK
ncbi:MAG: hypothetical protein K8823_1107 [Cenarchaeum symbiont of Oopsacas minuta]|nr:hypothetical protein [Cenarchaeum symbiont of Oopsacas minuta]